MGYISRNRRKFTIGGLLGLLGGAGVATAAILLTTTITGNATVNSIATSNSVAVTASAVSGSQLDCTDVHVTDDSKTLTVNPVLTKHVGGSNSTGAPVPGGTCTITLTVHNTGNTPLKVDGSSAISALPTGWNTTAFIGNALSPIAAGATATLAVTLSADQNAISGKFSGQLVYSD